MTKQDIMERMMTFCIRVINMATHLPETVTGEVIRDQILRSALSLSAGQRSACRTRSQRDFINRLKIVEERVDETLFWMEIIEQTELIRAEKLQKLKEENAELLAIIASSIKTAQQTMKTTIVRNKKSA
jgi:four helix bundle protein